MLTFLLVCIAIIAAVQLIVKCIYAICIWVVAVSRRWSAERKRPKPPIPPKPNLKKQDEQTNPAEEKIMGEMPKMEETITVEITSPKSPDRNVTDETARLSNGSASGKVDPRPASLKAPITRARSGSFSEGVKVNSVSPGSFGLDSRSRSPIPQRQQFDHIARDESIESAEDDICCTNFTSLITSKAKAFSQPYTLAKRGRSPPAKPPKPSAEAIALAKGRTTSFGDDIPVGVDGFKYADDTETESSLDYKDVIFDKGGAVSVDVLETTLTNEERFNKMLLRVNPSPRPSPLPSPRPSPPSSPRLRVSPIPPPEINVENYEDEVFSDEKFTNETELPPINYQVFPDLIVREKPKKARPPPKRYHNFPESNIRHVTEGYCVSDSESVFGLPESRRSWPAAKRNKKGKKVPPARPPPPKRDGLPKTVCFSDDETSRREDYLYNEAKPTRPPPPKKPVRFAPLPPSYSSTEISMQPKVEKPPRTVSPPSAMRQPFRDVSPMPTRQSVRDVSPMPTRQSVRDVSPMPTRQSVRDVSPMPTRQSVRDVSPMPTRQSVRDVSPMPTRQSARDVSPMPTRQSARDVSPMPTRQYARDSSPMPTRLPARGASPMPVRQQSSMPLQQSYRAVSPTPPNQQIRGASTIPPSQQIRGASIIPPSYQFRESSPMPPSQQIRGALPMPSNQQIRGSSPMPPSYQFREASPMPPSHQMRGASQMAPSQQIRGASQMAPSQQIRGASPMPPSQQIRGASQMPPSYQFKEASPMPPSQQFRDASPMPSRQAPTKPTRPLSPPVRSMSPPNRPTSRPLSPPPRPLPPKERPTSAPLQSQSYQDNSFQSERPPSPTLRDRMTNFQNEKDRLQNMELETGPNFMQRRIVQSPSNIAEKQSRGATVDSRMTESRFATVPRAPPRQRRQRSRTVEITSSEWRQSLPEVNNKRRALSMSDRDKRYSDVSSDALSTNFNPGAGSRALYSQVNKLPPVSSSTVSLPGYVGKKIPSQDQISDKFKFRPLPAPPAPPRQARHPTLKRTNPRDDPYAQSSPYEDSEYSEPYQSRERTNDSVSSIGAVNTQVQYRDDNANFKEIPSTASPLRESDARSRLRSKSEIASPEELARRNKRRPNSRFYTDTPSNEVISHLQARDQFASSMSPSPIPLRFENTPQRRREMDDGGHVADIESSAYSSRQPSMERINSRSEQLGRNNSQKRIETRSNGKKNQANRSSVFYYDLPPDTDIPPPVQQSDSSRVRNVSDLPFEEKPVQTSTAPSEIAEDDDLLDITNNLRKELNTILQRRGKPGVNNVTPRNLRMREPDQESELSSATESQNDDYVRRLTAKKSNISVGSARSSEASWHASSEESEEETSSSSAGHSKMTAEEKQYRKLFYIAREIMTSEEAFVDVLRLLNVDFQGAVRRVSIERGSNIVPDEILTTLFGYLPQLQHLNEKLLSEFKERLERWDDIQKISDIVVEIGPFLKLYSSYIRNFDFMCKVLDDSVKKYPIFGQVVKEFEAGPQCHKLALKHFLLKPVQRIPQYRLLLQDYLNHLDEESPDFQDTRKALRIVSDVADHANNTMKQGDNSSKLISIQNSLLGRHEIVKPGKVFLREGELMKLSRKVPQPRWFILFNDSLLYLTPTQQGMYKVNHELPLTGMRVNVPIQNDYRNEFSIISVTRSFSLAAKTQTDRDEWVMALTRAIEENAAKRSSFISVQSQQKGQVIAQESDIALGEQAPVWIPDARVTMCQLCTTEFTITYRRHHCRACGRVVCKSCSANRGSLKYLNFRIVRVCNVCYTKLQEAYEANIAALDSGSSLASSTSDLRPQSTQGSAFLDSKRTKPVVRSESDSSDTRTPNRNSRIPATNTGGRIRYVPERLKEVQANDQGSDISGYLHELNKRSWKRYWFVLKSKVLYTYKASEDVAALKSIPILGFKIQTFDEPFEGISGSLMFKLTHSGHPDIIFYAESVGSTERWVKAMRNATILE